MLRKSSFFPSVEVRSEFGGQMSFRKKPGEYVVTKWGHILRFYVLRKQLQWIISHEAANNGGLIKYTQNLLKNL